MTRVAPLMSYVGRDELARRYRQAPSVVEARRWHLQRLIATDHTIKEAAAEVGLHERARQAVERCLVRRLEALEYAVSLQPMAPAA